MMQEIQNTDREIKLVIYLNKNQRQLYTELNQKHKSCEEKKPDTGQSKKCWTSIWNESLEHKRHDDGNRRKQI